MFPIRPQSSLVHCLYGHSARVWDVHMMESSFASVGEDSTCIVWGYDGNIHRKFKGHQGKSIWSMTATEDEKFLVTGGGDASVRLWSLDKGVGPVSQFTLTLPQSTGAFLSFICCSLPLPAVYFSCFYM